LCCFCDSEAIVPTNVQYLGLGYDAVFGNPHTTSINEMPDPGFRAAVFNMTNFNPLSYAQSCAACKLKMMTRIIETVNNYSQTLRDFTSFNLNWSPSPAPDTLPPGGGQSSVPVVPDTGAPVQDVKPPEPASDFKFAFAASNDYKHVEESTSYNLNKFTETYVECCTYRASLPVDYTSAVVTSDFAEAVAQMPFTNKSNPTFFKRFFSFFGTHVIDRMRFGGMFGVRSRITKANWTKMVQDNKDVTFKAEMSMKGFGIGFNRLSSSEQKSASSFDKFTSKQTLFFKGGKLPVDWNASTWASELSNDPLPISYELVGIERVLTATRFPKDKNLKAKRKNLVAAISGYCAQLKAAGKVTKCPK